MLFVIFPLLLLIFFRASLVAKMLRIRQQCGRPGFDSWVGKIRWRRAWQPTPIFLPGESPWTEEPHRLQSMGSKELDTTERLSTALSLIFVSLIKVCLSVFRLWFTLPEILCTSCTWLTISFPCLGRFQLLISY